MMSSPEPDGAGLRGDILSSCRNLLPSSKTTSSLRSEASFMPADAVSRREAVLASAFPGHISAGLMSSAASEARDRDAAAYK